MKIKLEKHGGFVFGIHQPATTIDCSSLSDSKKAEVGQLVSDVKAAAPLQEEKSDLMRDAMSYTISIEEDGKTTVHQQADLRMSNEFAKLLAWIERHA